MRRQAQAGPKQVAIRPLFHHLGADTSDLGVAVISRPIDRFPLRFKVGEDVVRIVFDK
jgi:hypothetical protein